MTNERTEILVRTDHVSRLVRNKYVRIVNNSEGKEEFLGRIIEGPFYKPEEVSRDSALAQTAILQGEEFPSAPNYYAVGGIQILGQLKEGRVFGVNTRPAPQSKVEELTGDEVKSLLAIAGDILLGSLDGYPDVDVSLRSDLKSVLPRNVGIFGTVGSGKSNTAQVVIEEALKAGYAVIVVDVEGEYTEMDKPSEEKDLVTVLKKRYKRDPAGISNFKVYYPVAAESERADATAFMLRISDYDPMVLSEILGAEEAQERRLIGVLEDLKKEHEKAKGKKEVAELKQIISPKTGKEVPYDIHMVMNAVGERAREGKGVDQISYWALLGKLARFYRANIFDVKDKDTIDAGKLVQAGYLSVVDVSYTSVMGKNLVIADILRKVFEYKLSNKTAPRTLIVIEEAHTFISRETKDKMAETIEMLREIARRGRKRWLGLCFISQQPGHLPDEIFELCNTRIVHNVKSRHNLNALILTAGDVTEEMWRNCPTLGVGQAVLSCPQLRDPIVINVRPAACKRKFVD
jgi:DNA helicase HerA-like ATPase